MDGGRMLVFVSFRTDDSPDPEVRTLPLVRNTWKATSPASASAGSGDPASSRYCSGFVGTWSFSSSAVQQTSFFKL